MRTKTVVKERPILFTGEMVRAILEGRKAQTRRVIKSQPVWIRDFKEWLWGIPGKVVRMSGDLGWPNSMIEFCPHGVPGDRLWVKENWADVFRRTETNNGCLYRVDDDGIRINPGSMDGRWKSSRFMPRWASRITLEITAVRVERVQEISEQDALTEGVREHEYVATGDHPTMIGYVTDADGEFGAAHVKPQEAFAKLWDSLNAKRGYSWEANPWVWVIEFRKLGAT